MKRHWTWLTSGQNAVALTLLLTVMTVLVAGGWAVFQHIQKPDATVRIGTVEVSDSAKGNTITVYNTINSNSAELYELLRKQNRENDELKRRIEDLQMKLELTDLQMKDAYRRAAAAEQASGDGLKTFTLAVARYQELRERANQNATTGAVDDLRQDLLSALANGDLKRAEAIDAQRELMVANPPTRSPDPPQKPKSAEPWWRGMFGRWFEPERRVSLDLPDTDFLNQYGRVVNIRRDRKTIKLVTFSYFRSPCPASIDIIAAARFSFGKTFDLQGYVVLIDPEEASTYAQDVKLNLPIHTLHADGQSLLSFKTSLKAYSRKIPKSDGSYTIGHTTMIYIFDREGSFTSFVSPEDLKSIYGIRVFLDRLRSASGLSARLREGWLSMAAWAADDPQPDAAMSALTSDFETRLRTGVRECR
ncbi:MAG: SCO family protein [Burkholderiales bacterium]|nr:SCO family protein [Burkholderiales bacterium]